MNIMGRALGKVGEYFVARIDRYFHALIVVDAFHAMIHQGRAFSVTDYDADVDISGPKHWRITAPESGDAETHLAWLINADGPGVITLEEDGDSATAGSALAAKNRKRESDNTAFASFAKDSTIATQGEVLETIRLGIGGNPARSSGGDASGRHEWELNPESAYELVFTPDADDTQVWLNLDLYDVVSDEL